MRRSKSEVYLHLVWATERRQPWISPDIERAVLRCIENEAQQLGCAVLAVNCMPDHVHLLVKVPGRISPAELAKQVKGVSSRFVHTTLRPGEHFAWQEGYAVFSVCRTHTAPIISYIERQREHHSSGKLWPSLEEVDEENSDR
jgi:putative transposase